MTEAPFKEEIYQPIKIKVDDANYPSVLTSIGEIYRYDGNEWILQGRDFIDFANRKIEDKIWAVSYYGEVKSFKV